MIGKSDPLQFDLNFLKGTVYKDLRKIGVNAYRDIKMSLTLGTSSDLIYYLKDHSKLLKNFNGNELVEILNKGMFSYVYLIKDHGGREIVVKRSHDGWIPLQVFRDFYISIPRSLIGMFFSNYGIGEASLKRDVYDYEKIIKPYWGSKRAKLEGRKFMPYLNMALYMVDHFLPEFRVSDIYEKKFWKNLLRKKRHKNLTKLQKYLRRIKIQKNLIPNEERFVLYDAFSKSLQTVFIQEAMVGRSEVIPDKRMAFPFELISSGVIPKEMPKHMIEHLLRSIESFVSQIDAKCEIKKVPDFRPVDAWKIMPPTPYEMYIAETNNIVVNKGKSGELKVSLVDTHYLLESEGNMIYKWTERRYWVSMFLNLRFWIRKALEFA
jgi:hypothetical protein